MTTATNTLTIKTGKRSWTLRVVEKKHAKLFLVQTVRKNGKLGKLYTFNPFTRTLSGVRPSRTNGERLYNWHVTELEGASMWDWRTVSRKLRPAATKKAA